MLLFWRFISGGRWHISCTSRAPEKVMFRNVTCHPVTIPFHFRLNYVNASVPETFKSTKVGRVGINLHYSIYSVIQALLHKPIYIIWITYNRWFVFPWNKKTNKNEPGNSNIMSRFAKKENHVILKTQAFRELENLQSGGHSTHRPVMPYLLQSCSQNGLCCN